MRRSLMVLAVLAIAAPAAADPRAECVAAYESGQRLRKAGDLLASRSELARCARADCPDLVRGDCVEWLRQVEEALPTLVIRVQDERGADVADASVALDGKPFARRTDGRAIPINPGEHRILVERAGAKVERVIVMGQGEKNRVVVVTLPAAEPAAPMSSEPARSEAPPADPSASGGPPAAAWIFGGLSVVALGSFAYFGLTGTSEIDDLRDTCAPKCEEQDLNAAKRKLIIADISLAVAALSGGVAIWLFTSGDGSPEQPRVSGGIAPRAHGADLALRLVF